MSMDPKEPCAIITRVVNGWTIGPFRWRQGEVLEQQYVARTPKELADLIHEWASKQTDIKG